jgi:hypothetical protein
MRTFAILFLLCGCATTTKVPGDHDGRPTSCERDDDCLWSRCSESRCEHGVCAHEYRGEGALCGSPALGYGTCIESTCIIDPRNPVVECAKPNVGPAPVSCEQDRDCSWSECSVSSCVDGLCVHEESTDGAVCPAGPLGTGICSECLCVVET